MAVFLYKQSQKMVTPNRYDSALYHTGFKCCNLLLGKFYVNCNTIKVYVYTMGMFNLHIYLTRDVFTFNINKHRALSVTEK